MNFLDGLKFPDSPPTHTDIGIFGTQILGVRNFRYRIIGKNFKLQFGDKFTVT